MFVLHQENVFLTQLTGEFTIKADSLADEIIGPTERQVSTMKEKKKVTVAVLGAGAIAQRRHGPEYAARDDVILAGFFDPDQERAQEVAEQFGGRAYATPEEVFQDPAVEAVSVCAPNSLHAAYSIAALNAGKHVLCEKPMALSLEETRAMLEAQKSSGKILMPGHNQRLIPTHRKAKELLEKGAIGKPLFFQCNFKHSGPENWSINNTNSTWFFDKKKAQFGVFGDLGSHKIDLIRFLTGAEIVSVFATTMTLDKKHEDGTLIDLDDNVVCQFRLSNGMPGIMHFSWTNYGQEDNSSVIYGEEGVMKIFGDYTDDIVLEMRDKTLVKYHVGAISTNEQQLSSGVIDEFINAIQENRSPIVTGIDGHNTLAVLQAGVESSKSQQWVSVVY